MQRRRSQRLRHCPLHVGRGRIDAAFGSGGYVLTHFDARTDDVARVVAIQSDQKIVVAGSSNAKPEDVAIVRYNPEGSLDAGFGSAGKVLTAHGDAIDIAVQADGKILVSGVRGRTLQP